MHYNYRINVDVLRIVQRCFKGSSKVYQGCVHRKRFTPSAQSMKIKISNNNGDFGGGTNKIL